MDWVKIILTVMVFYSLIASFFVKKTKTYLSCFLLSCVLAVGGVFAFEMMQTYRESIEDAIKTIMISFDNLYS